MLEFPLFVSLYVEEKERKIVQDYLYLWLRFAKFCMQENCVNLPFDGGGCCWVTIVDTSHTLSNIL